LEGKEVRQTKEHLWSGACIATNEIMKQWIQEVEEKLEQWKVGQLQVPVIQAIIKRVQKVDLLRHSLENHACGAMLMGWDNEFIQEMKLEISKGGVEAERAMNLALTLMGSHMTAVPEIHRRWYQMVQVWEKPLTEEEVDMWDRVQHGGDPEDLTVRCYRLWKGWWMGGPERTPMPETWARQAVREMMAWEQGVRI